MCVLKQRVEPYQVLDFNRSVHALMTSTLLKLHQPLSVAGKLPSPHAFTARSISTASELVTSCWSVLARSTSYCVCRRFSAMSLSYAASAARRASGEELFRSDAH